MIEYGIRCSDDGEVTEGYDSAADAVWQCDVNICPLDSRLSPTVPHTHDPVQREVGPWVAVPLGVSDIRPENNQGAQT